MRRACLTFALVLNLTFAAAAEEGAGYEHPLFDGESLAGWTVTDCEVEVQDGSILLESGNGLVRTHQQFRDFVLEVEWKALEEEGWDSGIFFRAPLPPQGRPWPKRYQVNLRQGMEGNVGGLEGAVNKVPIKPGEWNRFRLTVRGTRAALEVNGKPAWEADGLDNAVGYIALQAEVPGGGPFLFRNIRITETGYRPLFNGKDLSGWEGAGRPAEECWQIEEGGVLMCTGKRGPWLRSKEQFGDFNLRFQYQVKPGGNSGVYVRVPESGNHHGAGAGVEIQVLDDAAEKYRNLKPYQFCGSVYAIAPSTKHVGLPPGEWNTLEIDAAGPNYRVTHNGVVIVDAQVGEFPKLAERRREGFLGFQNHSSEVRYRHIRVREEESAGAGER